MRGQYEFGSLAGYEKVTVRNIFFANSQFYCFRLHFDQRLSTPKIYRMLDALTQHPELGSCFAVYKHIARETFLLKTYLHNQDCELPYSEGGQLAYLDGDRLFLTETFIQAVWMSMTHRFGDDFVQENNLTCNDFVMGAKINRFVSHGLFVQGRNNSFQIQEVRDEDTARPLQEEVEEDYVFDYGNSAHTLNSQTILLFSEHPVPSSFITSKSFESDHYVHMCSFCVPTQNFIPKEFIDVITETSLLDKMPEFGSSASFSVESRIFDEISVENFVKFNKIDPNTDYKNCYLQDRPFLWAVFIECLLCRLDWYLNLRKNFHARVLPRATGTRVDNS